ncbi:hypothetical protein BKA66DRAFT_407987 [Pyrenochaeta sp. MPI-SDFR-AT-0127]|nr:hypothetical protein BKA66DRAFT_407987 [Pyrenochaeta sp. MPI-SDFR-AT-0127]
MCRSIYSARTIAPLDITPTLLDSILRKWEVPQSFRDIVLSFGRVPDASEGSHSHFGSAKREFKQEVWYRLCFVEQNMRSAHTPWSLRHTGVYHRHSQPNAPDLVILLHCVRDPTLDRQVMSLEHDASQRADLCADPRLIHTWLYSTYNHWHQYLQHICANTFEDDLELVQKPGDTTADSCFRRIQSLRHAKETFAHARTCCTITSELLGRLLALQKRSSTQAAGMREFKAKLIGYGRTADNSLQRVQDLIDLIKTTQSEAARVGAQLRDITENIKALTEETVNDSTAVKIITFLSAIYLPGTFVATLFGMNFFAFDDLSGRLKISPDFWIFSASWLPLSVVTGASYVFIQYFYSRRRRRRP